MNGINQNDNHNLEKTHSGCLGKMANFLERNIGLSTNRLLTDRPYRDGSPLYRSRTYISKMSPSGDHIEDKETVSEFHNCLSNRKPDRLPMNILIAQEMSKEVHFSDDAPNLVSKLMGLDAIPRKEPDSARQRSLSRGYPRSRSDKSREQPDGLLDHGLPVECQEFCDILQQSQKLPHKGRCEEAINDKMMDLVRQKFIEAKHLSMDKNLRKSKKFRDALEVLSSNKDLFLKCLQEPNSMLYQHLHSQRSVPPPTERKRITVLRPSKMPDSNNLTEGGNMDRKQMKKSSFCQMNQLEKIHPGSCPPESFNSYENSSQPTHIIVLKPSPEILYDIKASFPQSEAQRILRGEDFLGDVEDTEDKKSKEDAAVAVQQMCEKLGKHRGDGTLYFSTFSSGYVGDTSSSNKSEIEYADGNLSDLGDTSPTCRHSWDGGNRLEIPYSSTLRRASSSSKSSVSREAKRRLSERWAMMVSHGSCQETKLTQRSSVTLGDMLAISEAQRACTRQVGSSNQEMRDSNSLSVSEVRQNDNVDNSPRNFSRSKSVPVSSTKFSVNLNIGISVSDKGKSAATKEEARTGVKSSFKGKLSSLFFSRSRKPCKEKFVVSEVRNDHLLAKESCINRAANLGDGRLDHASPGMQELSSKSSSSSSISNHDITSPENGIFVAEPMASKSPSKNQDQPSPVSVLDTPFEEHSTNVIPHYAEPDQLGVEAQDNSVQSNLIDKSPVIESMARSPSWFFDSRLDEASSHLTKEALTIPDTDNEEKEWCSFVKTLLCAADLNREVQSSLFLERWHSPNSPLDPSLRDQHIDSKDKEILHDAKQRQKRTTQKLMFDSVNAVLVEITEYASGMVPRTTPLSTSLEEVWTRLRTMFTGEFRCAMEECGDEDDDDDDNSCFIVETMVTKETAGKVWMDELRLEMNVLGKEIGEELVEELVQEAVAELKVNA